MQTKKNQQRIYEEEIKYCEKLTGKKNNIIKKLEIRRNNKKKIVSYVHSHIEIVVIAQTRPIQVGWILEHNAKWKPICLSQNSVESLQRNAEALSDTTIVFKRHKLNIKILHAK